MLWGSVPANDQLILFSGLTGVIGYHPRPEEVFESLELFEDDSRTNSFYQQDPVADSLWEHVLQPCQGLKP